MLAHETPACRLVREAVDLTDAEARTAFLARVSGPALRMLVVTEGLLAYLDDGVVRTLARDLATRAPVRWWILDLLSPALRSAMKKDMNAHFAQAPLRFGPESGVRGLDVQRVASPVEALPLVVCRLTIEELLERIFEVTH